MFNKILMSTLTMGAVLANAAIIAPPTLDVNLCPDGSAAMNVTSTLLPDGLSFVSKVCPIVEDTSLDEGTFEISSRGLTKRGNTCGMSCVRHCESNITCSGGGPNTNGFFFTSSAEALGAYPSDRLP
ncbi:hypothetical protein B0H14DRAFT_2601104 [Mycena olivaceomarginata]|nr:hypothetical protein B0H14DRAFT_2601104 [Mycena olivaceomarginata]